MTVESINGDVSGAVGPAVPGEASEESRVPDNRVREVWATIKRLTKSKFTRVFVSDDDDDDAWMLQYAVSDYERHFVSERVIFEPDADSVQIRILYPFRIPPETLPFAQAYVSTEAFGMRFAGEAGQRRRDHLQLHDSLSHRRPIPGRGVRGSAGADRARGAESVLEAQGICGRRTRRRGDRRVPDLAAVGARDGREP